MTIISTSIHDMIFVWEKNYQSEKEKKEKKSVKKKIVLCLKSVSTFLLMLK